MNGEEGGRANSFDFPTWKFHVLNCPKICMTGGATLLYAADCFLRPWHVRTLYHVMAQCSRIPRHGLGRAVGGTGTGSGAQWVSECIFYPFFCFACKASSLFGVSHGDTTPDGALHVCRSASSGRLRVLGLHRVSTATRPCHAGRTHSRFTALNHQGLHPEH